MLRSKFIIKIILYVRLLSDIFIHLYKKNFLSFYKKLKYKKTILFNYLIYELHSAHIKFI